MQLSAHYRRAARSFCAPTLLIYCVLLIAIHSASADDVTIATSRFGNVKILRSQGPTEHFVIFLDESAGGEQPADAAKSLTQLGATVAVVEATRYVEMLSRDEADCLYLAGEFERLGQVLQSTLKVERYLTPIIAGKGSGAGLAYVIGSESPQGFRLGVLYDFCPRLAFAERGLIAGMPFCEETEPQLLKEGDFNLTPSLNATTPFLVVNNPSYTGCPTAALTAFVHKLPGSAIVSDSAAIAARMKEVGTPRAASGNFLQTKVADLPLIELSLAKGKPLILILSGDGGWASIDKELGEYLSQRDNAVVGFDCLKYFWSKKQPMSAATDLARVVEYYSKALNPSSITLVGYSYGAQVLPFIFNRLSSAAAGQVSTLILLNPGKKTEFEIHFSDWISEDDEDGVPIKPELDRIGSLPVSCIYGSEEEDSLCRILSPSQVKIVELPGGHHFDGDYSGLAKVILESAARGEHR